MTRPRPSFDELPLQKGTNHPGNAWGLYGKDDELGSLNLLTEERVKAAASLIQTGQRFPLDLPLGYFEPPAFGRLPFKHEIVHGNRSSDDVVTFNTQSSTQWDGLRHFRHFAAQRYYGDRKAEDVFAGNAIGTQAWVEKGGVVGRAVLLDYVAYAERHQLEIDNYSHDKPITAKVLQEIAQEQKVEFQPGDILLVRSGFLKARNQKSKEELDAWIKKGSFDTLGVESSKDTLRFIWDNQFAAVAGDAPAFEAWPPQSTDFFLHEWLLAGWGTPIGELFNLEQLAGACATANRYEFFLSSMPLHVDGGVASPPNAVAIL